MALAKAPSFVGLNDVRAAPLVRLREAIAPILANNLLPHFTDHSIEHSDNLVCLVQELAGPVADTKHALNSDELVVLYSACYLHDIGMQYERPFEVGIPPEAEQRVPWQDLADSTKRDLLRRYHNVASARLVQLSATITPAPVGLALDEVYRPARVTDACPYRKPHPA